MVIPCFGSMSHSIWCHDLKDVAWLHVNPDRCSPPLQWLSCRTASLTFCCLFLLGFELYSMVPSICPLETLHNALFLKQVDDFLASIASPSTEVLRKVPETSSVASRSSPGIRRKISLNTYTPTKILPTPPAAVKSTKASSKAAAGGPSVAMASHTSSRKKSLSSKTEGHEPKKSTGKKRWAHSRTGGPVLRKGLVA